MSAMLWSLFHIWMSCEGHIDIGWFSLGICIPVYNIMHSKPWFHNRILEMTPDATYKGSEELCCLLPSPVISVSQLHLHNQLRCLIGYGFLLLRVSTVLCCMICSETYHKNYRFVFISKVGCKHLLSVHISSSKICYIIIGLFIER